MKTTLITTALLATLALAAGQAAPDDAAAIAAQKPSYVLTTCPISGEALGSGGMVQVDLLHEGQLVSLCCKGCAKDFAKAPAEVLRKIEASIVAAQKADYPLATCVVDGKELGKEPQMAVAASKLVELCSAECATALAADRAGFVAKLDAAYIEKQSKDYPSASCFMSDEELGDRPVQVLHGTTLVQLCCKDCAKDFQKDPKPTLAKLAAARAAKPAAKEPAKADAPAAPARDG
jgi:hypothetical protein